MKKFLVALQTGGETGCPEVSYSDYQIIEAENKTEAVEKYDSQNNCSYYYGTCIGEVDEAKQTVNVPISIFIKNKR